LVHPTKVLTNASARPGDRLILTKPLGTGFVTTAHKKGKCGPGDKVFDAAVSNMVRLNDQGCAAMIEVGVSAATDVTGFGLAGHAFEMAEGSGVTLVLELNRLPLLPGADRFVAAGYRTRASATNAAYVADGLRLEGAADPIRLDFFYDAQTSGGLLISVPAERADALLRKLHERGVLDACLIGEVRPFDGARLVVRP
jgi:selenide,water dikinase